MKPVKIAVFDAAEKPGAFNESLHRALSENSREVSWCRLPEMSVQPCRSCGSCAMRTEGECVLKDEMQDVLKAFASSRVIIFLTPIRFGGYYSQLKKAVDRLLPVGLPFYIVKNGHLLHPMRYGRKLIVGLGLSENGNPAEENNFRGLVNANGINMLSDSLSLVFRAEDDPNILIKQVEKSIQEVESL